MINLDGGGNRIRTDDILLAKQTLYQLSYTPVSFEFGYSFDRKTEMYAAS